MSDQSPQVGVEPDNLPFGKLFIWIGALCAAVIVFVILVWQVFRVATATEIATKQGSDALHPLLAESRATEEALLSGYAQVDDKRGFFRIPVSAAMDRLLSRPQLIRPQIASVAAKRPPAATINEEKAAEVKATKAADGAQGSPRTDEGRSAME